MAGLSLKHIYKIYPGKETAKKKLFRKKKDGDEMNWTLGLSILLFS